MGCRREPCKLPWGPFVSVCQGMHWREPSLLCKPFFVGLGCPLKDTRHFFCNSGKLHKEFHLQNLSPSCSWAHPGNNKLIREEAEVKEKEEEKMKKQMKDWLIYLHPQTTWCKLSSSSFPFLIYYQQPSLCLSAEQMIINTSLEY